MKNKNFCMRIDYETKKMLERLQAIYGINASAVVTMLITKEFYISAENKRT